MASYQQIAAQHRAGNPPNTDPQRTTETFAAYQARMAAAGFSPDILVGETDSDYEARLRSYEPAPPFELETSSYALSTLRSDNAAAQLTSSLSWASSSTNLFSGTSSFASFAGTVDAGTNTASYLDGTRAQLNGVAVTALTVTTTTGTGVDSRASTSGRGVYAQALLSEAVLAAQSGLPTGNINSSVVQATRAISNLNGQDTPSAVLGVQDQYGLGTGPLIAAFHQTSEVFRVDQTGSLYSSGSKGVTQDVMFLADGAVAVTMSFRGGLLVAVS